MVEFKLHCVFNLEQRRFVLSLGKSAIVIHPDQMGRVIAHARDYQRKENGNFDFTIEVPLPEGCYVVGPREMEKSMKYRFVNVSKDFCETVIEYLDRVYTGWKKMWFGDDGQNKLRCMPCT